MNFKFKNIGSIPENHPISEMGIGLSGVTILKGDNAKTTIARALFCTINGFYNTDKTIEDAKIEKIKSKLRRVCFHEYGSSESNEDDIYLAIAKKIYFEADRENPEGYIKDIINKKLPCGSQIDLGLDYEKLVETAVEDITKIIKKYIGDIMTPFVMQYFHNEFKGQIKNIASDNPVSEVIIETFRETKFTITDDKEIKLTKLLSFTGRAFYLDNIFLLDKMYEPQEHRTVYDLIHTRGIILRQEHMQAFLNNSVDDTVMQNPAVKKVLDRIRMILQGEILQEKKSFVYKMKGASNPIKLANMASSLKPFAMIGQLLANGSLTKGGVLILDNIDTQLDKKYRKYLNALIVALYKELSIKTLLISGETTDLESLMEAENIPYEINLLTY